MAVGVRGTQSRRGWDAGGVTTPVEHPTTPSGRLYREKLWPGPLGWFLVVGLTVMVMIALLPVDLTVTVVGGVLATVAGVAVAVRTSPEVRVEGGELVAGAAHIPVTLLGAGRVLDREGVRTALGPGSDARAYVLLRAWVPGAVELTVEDPLDPTPSWFVSTRRPQALLAAVQAARGAQVPGPRT